MVVLCCVTFHPLCELSDYTAVGTALNHTLSMGMPAIDPGVSQMLFSPGHQHRSTEVRSQDCSHHGSGPSVCAMGGAAQTLAWPNPCVYVPTKSTAAKVRPVLSAGAFIVCSDVLQVLSLQSRSQGCHSVVRAAARRDFSFSSLVAQPLGLSCGFSPTSSCGPPTGLCSQGRSPPWQGGAWRPQ